jgi:3-methylfumaryl-CoA hydratase
VEIDLPLLRQWIGRTETIADRITPVPLRALAATLDRLEPDPRPGEEVPPGGHWLFFLTTPRQSEIDTDGHPRRGGFLPPVPLPRRMWVGGRIRWILPLRVGSSYTRTSRIVAVDLKEGRSGPLVFVKVQHEVANESGVAIEEEQDIVYRDLPRPDAANPAAAAAPAACDWSRDMPADPVLLFRYSALTFNGHRIHYDRAYATTSEGYAGLVVHGPLLATLILDLLRRSLPLAWVRSFSFRAVKPTFDIAPLKVCGVREEGGGSARLWVAQSDGSLAMDSTAQLA